MKTAQPSGFAGLENSVSKGYVTGTHRTRSPAETLDDFLRWMPLMGITRIANVTGLDSIGLPVYTAIRPNSRALATAQGKGMDADAAKASAFMESTESWHAENIDHTLIRESYASLRTHANVVDITALPVRKGSRLRRNKVHDWIEGFDIMGGRPIWVPYEMVSMDFVSTYIDQVTFRKTSNGLASGNHVLEAVLHGIYEVIERDAEAIWKITDDFRQLDLQTVDDPCCYKTIDLLASAKVHVAAWNLTIDTGIPVYGCVVLDPPNRPGWRSLGVYYGFGCHLSPEIALLRALTEAVQSRVTYISGSRDNLYYDDYAETADPCLLREVWEEITNAPYLESFSVQQSLATNTFEEDLAVVLSSLKNAGIQCVAVVDLTKPELGIPVVRVVIPGLEGPSDGFWRPGNRARRFQKAGKA